jgi:hypothetical protein
MVDLPPVIRRARRSIGGRILRLMPDTTRVEARAMIHRWIDF